MPQRAHPLLTASNELWKSTPTGDNQLAMHETNPVVGSRWRQWDLHVHTPASLVNSYGGSDGWPRFLDDLAALPEGYVLGINDYIFVDGYERVAGEHAAGNLPNVAAVFPVVEFRLSNLVGTHGHLGKINAHVIFSNEIAPDTIRGQFINGLSPKFRLDPQLGLDTEWKGIPTLAGLAEFGAAIRKSLPKEREDEYSESDLVLGFNNLVIPLEAIEERLEDSVFRNRAVLAVGKAEWESMSWNDKSIALKKSVINSGKLVFTAASDLDAYHEGRKRLTDAGINDRLVDCSDAHSFSDAEHKDRIGNCLTWMNADPTFDGLQHAITEYEERIYVGSEPPKLAAVRLNSDHHIREVAIRAKPGRDDDSHNFFQVDIPLNAGFVAVVGNKGKGKSALLDSIGLAVGSRNESDFTFLSDSRFRNPQRNMAKAYEVEVTWHDGDSLVRGLDERTTEDQAERATYLPQQLIDTICSADPGEAPARRFAAELGKVLFAHVPESDRLGTTDLESLITARTNEIERRLEILRGELATINRNIVLNEQRIRPRRRRELTAELKLVEDQLSTHEKTKPPDPKKPPSLSEDPELSATSELLADLKAKKEQVQAERMDLEVQDKVLATKADDTAQLSTALKTLQDQTTEFMRVNRPRAERLGIDIEELVSVSISSDQLATMRTQVAEQREAIRDQLDGQGADSTKQRIIEFDKEIEKAEEKLKGPVRQYAEEVKAIEEWTAVRQRLAEGTRDSPGVATLQAQLGELDKVPGILGDQQQERRDKVLEIHSALMEVVEVYKDLYRPALTFIDGHPLAQRAQLEFGVGLQERDLATLLWEMYARNVVGSFQGIDEANRALSDLVKKTDFTDSDAVLSFVDELDRAIHNDLRSTPPEPVDPFKAIRTGHSLEAVYDLMFGLDYLEPVYALEYSGVPLDRLSPGEKGTLLLMFYLLVDQSPKPILLDQPDENLDNQTIHDLLVPAIKEAKRRRQVVVITHNPNVAVVADADQIIAASFDESQFTYEGGSIEAWEINKEVVDVLEGTWPAFMNRGAKYQEPTEA